MRRIVVVLSLACILGIVGARVSQPQPQTSTTPTTPPHDEQHQHHQHIEHEQSHSFQQ